MSNFFTKGKLTIALSKRLFWKIVVYANNGEAILTSETYYSKSNAVRALERLRKEFK